LRFWGIMLSIKNISYSVGGQDLLRKVSFEIKQGELISILGPNGAGKSTMVNLISGKNKIQTGEIFWQNQPIQEYRHDFLAKSRAILTQQTHVAFDFDVSSIAMMGRYPYFKNTPEKIDRQIVNIRLSQMDVFDFSKRSILSLSGGEQQRTHISRVLSQVHNENDEDIKLLLLDEPLNSLDIRHQHNVLSRSLQFAKAGNIVVNVLHDLNLAAMYSDKILLLKQGRLLAFGRPKDVFKEELITECYDFPAKVFSHPFYDIPQVYFGDNIKMETKNKCTTIKDEQMIR
ncbi:MAG: heme ABC transporter ATP-binding protein, partial [Chitinophagales bacterium]|nr:heme ABC transporter ATP-binding protein [Chitinophagales bacterium]